MSSLLNSWVLFNQSKTWRCRPSEILGVTDPYSAFCVDEAVYYVGISIQNELNEVEGREKDPKKARRKVESYLNNRLGIKPKFAVARPGQSR